MGLTYTDEQRIFPISSSLFRRKISDGVCVVRHGGQIINEQNFFANQLFNFCFVGLSGAVNNGINLLAEETKVVVVFCAQFLLDKLP